MIRHILIAAVLGLTLSACGVGADEDFSTLGQQLSSGTTVATQDPVPPRILIVDVNGNLAVVAAGSAAPGNPGDENSSSQDPIPPKVQNSANGVGPSGPNPGDPQVTRSLHK